ncbi:MAG TPA: SdrD B-like domain-containing protein, partial [Herpetosiphonaceae bacterium]|nr:SdrD B-like domain-containing protein [Herpetosiphonaceae bacterium]
QIETLLGPAGTTGNTPARRAGQRRVSPTGVRDRRRAPSRVLSGPQIVDALLSFTFLHDEAGVTPCEGDVVDAKQDTTKAAATWKYVSEQSGEIDLRKELDQEHNVAAYAYCMLESDRDTDALLSFGSDDGAVIWINGQEVWRASDARPYTADSDTVRVPVRRGINHCVVKIAQWIGDWKLRLRAVYGAQVGRLSGSIRLDRADGGSRPLAGILVTARNDDTDTITTTRTDTQGNYVFGALDLGTYMVFVPAQLNAGDAGVGTGNLRLRDPGQLRTLLKIGPGASPTRSFVYRQESSGQIRGIVFRDDDGNGEYFGDQGVPGVAVVLTDEQDETVEASTTDTRGDYLFDGLAPGSYTLRFGDVITSNGEDLELAMESKRQVKVEVQAGKTTSVDPIGYRPETHEIRGRVVYEDRETGIPGVIVVLMDQNGAGELARAVTDEQGAYSFSGYSGTFTVAFPDDPGGGLLTTPARQRIRVNSIVYLPDTIYRAGGGPRGADGGRGAPGSFNEALVDIAAYMPTTYERGGARGGGAGVRTSGALGDVVDAALTDVLGRRLRTDDPQLFRASLRQAFVREEVDGRPVYTWHPRSYAIQTELGGALTGAQASLYRRTKVAVDDTLPLLRAIQPLIPNPSSREVDATRSILETELKELAEELGHEGGPRAPRVDRIFSLLDQQLERMRDVFGLSDGNAVTVEAEGTLTDYLVICDHIRGLRTAWTDQLSGDRPALGTQLFLLSRALNVVAASVDEVYHAMDAVGLNEAERQTVRIPVPTSVAGNGRPPATTNGYAAPDLSVEDLMSWIVRFATREGQTLVKDAGRRGVAAIEPTATLLAQLVAATVAANNTHIGLSRARVRR